MKHSGGAKLIALMTAIALLAVLAVAAIPAGYGRENRALAQTCALQRQEIMRQYLLAKREKPDITLNEVLANQITNQTPCPAGGVYRATVVDGQPAITCSVHSDHDVLPPQGVAQAEKLYQDMAALFPAGEQAAGNDALRATLLQSYGSWPAFPENLVKEYRITEPKGQKLAMQPYVLDLAQPTQKVVVFAGGDTPDEQGNFTAGLIFDEENLTWYCAPKGKEITVDTMGWEQIKALLADWKALY